MQEISPIGLSHLPVKAAISEMLGLGGPHYPQEEEPGAVCPLDPWSFAENPPHPGDREL